MIRLESLVLIYQRSLNELLFFYLLINSKFGFWSETILLLLSYLFEWFSHQR